MFCIPGTSKIWWDTPLVWIFANCLVEETYNEQIFQIHFLFDKMWTHFCLFGTIMMAWVMSYIYNHHAVNMQHHWLSHLNPKICQYKFSDIVAQK